MFEIPVKEIIGFGIVLIGAFWGVMRLLVVQFQAQLREQMATLNEHMERQDDHARRMERELLEFKGTLPREYVRREDYNRDRSEMMVRIENVGLRIEKLILNQAVGKGSER